MLDLNLGLLAEWYDLVALLGMVILLVVVLFWLITGAVDKYAMGV